MQATSDFHHHVGKARFEVAKDLGDTPRAFNASHTMFDGHPRLRFQPIAEAIRRSQPLAARCAFRHDAMRPGWFISQVSQVFVQNRAGRIADGLGFDNAFFLRCAGGRGTEILNPSGAAVANYDIAIGMGLFLPV